VEGEEEEYNISPYCIIKFDLYTFQETFYLLLSLKNYSEILLLAVIAPFAIPVPGSNWNWNL
jgi:hypothetical protein